MGFSQQVYWGGLPLPPPVDHVLSELSTVASLSWVALTGMAHSFNELRKPLCHESDSATEQTQSKIARDLKKKSYVMRKRSIQDDIIIANIYIYAPNIGVPKYIKQILTDLEGLIDNTIIVSTSISYFQ